MNGLDPTSKVSPPRAPCAANNSLSGDHEPSLLYLSEERSCFLSFKETSSGLFHDMPPSSTGISGYTHFQCDEINVSIIMR